MFWQFCNPINDNITKWLFVFKYTNIPHDIKNRFSVFNFQCGVKTGLKQSLDVELITVGSLSVDLLFGIQGLVTIDNNLQIFDKLGISYESVKLESQHPFFANKSAINFIGIEKTPMKIICKNPLYPTISIPKLKGYVPKSQIFSVEGLQQFLVVTDMMKEKLLQAKTIGLTDEFFRKIEE